MEVRHENGSKTANIGSKLHIEAIQTVVPSKQTDPRHSIRVLVPGETFPGIFQRRFQVIMLYNAMDEGSGWVIAGWMKESLSWALAEESIFAGRLRRDENDGDNGDQLLEVVANDSGTRLVEATMEMELAEFLDHLKEKTGAEVELAFWGNINEQNPQFSPLCYVQVTNFKCGGFSIGISCSLLVTNPVSMVRFLKKWSDIHRCITSGPDAPKLPLFPLINIKATSSYPSLAVKSKTNVGKSMIFKASGKNLDHENHKNLAELCIHEAEKKLGRKAALSYSLLLKDASGDVKVEKISREANDQKKPPNGLFMCASWDSLEVEKVYFSESSKPIHVSTWINSVCEEGLVMIVPSSEDDVGVSITVTLPSEDMGWG